MHDKDIQGREDPSQQVIETVGSWPHVTKGDGPFGSPAFYVETSQIGHMHLDERPSVDITFPPPLREQLLAEGYTNEHPVDTGTPPKATLFIVESEADIDNAVWLFRLSLLVHVAILKSLDEPESTLLDVDVRNELDELEPSDAIRDAFEIAATDVSSGSSITRE